MSAYKKVMIIDDTPIDRFIAEKVIRKFDFAEDVVNVESGAIALEYLKQFAAVPHELPHLIFLDINMPDMNGFEFLEEYQKLPETIKKNCIVMMLTTSLHEEDKQKAEENPYVYKFINKPLNAEKLDEIKHDTATLATEPEA